MKERYGKHFLYFSSSGLFLQMCQCANAWHAWIGSYFCYLITRHIQNYGIIFTIHKNRDRARARARILCMAFMPIRHPHDNMLVSATELPCQRRAKHFFFFFSAGSSLPLSLSLLLLLSSWTTLPLPFLLPFYIFRTENFPKITTMCAACNGRVLFVYANLRDCKRHRHRHWHRHRNSSELIRSC